MSLDFADATYEIPKSGGGSFFRFEEGTNIIRITSGLVACYQYWTEEKQPVYSLENWEELPANARKDGDGKPERARHIWIVSLLHKGVHQVAEIRQATIQEAVLDYSRNPKWGHPCHYDFIIDFDKKRAPALMYSTMAQPKEGVSVEEMEEVLSVQYEPARVIVGESPLLDYDPDCLMTDIQKAMLNQCRKRFGMSDDKFKGAVAAVQGGEANTKKLTVSQGVQVLGLFEATPQTDATLEGVPF